MVAVKKVRRLKIAVLVANLITNLVAGLVAGLVASLITSLVAIHPINQSELMHLVHVHDPMHVSVLIHILSRYSHSFIVFVVFFFITLL